MVVMMWLVLLKELSRLQKQAFLFFTFWQVDSVPKTKWVLEHFFFFSVQCVKPCFASQQQQVKSTQRKWNWFIFLSTNTCLQSFLYMYVYVCLYYNKKNRFWTHFKRTTSVTQPPKHKVHLQTNSLNQKKATNNQMTPGPTNWK